MRYSAKPKDAIAMATALHAFHMLSSNTWSGMDLMMSCSVTSSGSSAPMDLRRGGEGEAGWAQLPAAEAARRRRGGTHAHAWPGCGVQRSAPEAKLLGQLVALLLAEVAHAGGAQVQAHRIRGGGAGAGAEAGGAQGRGGGDAACAGGHGPGREGGQRPESHALQGGRGERVAVWCIRAAGGDAQTEGRRGSQTRALRPRVLSQRPWANPLAPTGRAGVAAQVDTPAASL